MLDLLHTLPRYFNLAQWCLLSFFDKGMQHYNSSPYQCAEEYASNAFGSFET